MSSHHSPALVREQGHLHVQGDARLRPSGKARDLFPLPTPPEVCQERLLSRRSSQRLARKQRARSDLREAVRALNWMNGFSPQEEFVGLPDPMQSQVIGRAEYLCKLAEESGTYSDRGSPAGAAPGQNGV